MGSDTSQEEQQAPRSVLDLTHEEAEEFFLKSESYCSVDLPPYINFSTLIEKTKDILSAHTLCDLSQSTPRSSDRVNYVIYNNKDGRYAWRPFELIHPALYVSLVQQITSPRNWDSIKQRFKDFSQDKRIKCMSLPIRSYSKQKDKAEQITQWWQEIEQKSIVLSLEYKHLIETDITDCYGSIYTHSIAWALHTKPIAKQERRNTQLIGNIIDNHIQDMRHGQTNGIPQGSVLMDFVAEMVLGLVDNKISERLKGENITEFHILRYRDDYRIFVNNTQIGEMILKIITEETTKLGFKLNPVKTKITNDVVRNAIKLDKLAWLIRKQRNTGLQKHLLVIHDHATEFPNSGSLAVALNQYYKRVSTTVKPQEDLTPLIAIIVDIAYRNPRTYPVAFAILSKLLLFVESAIEREQITNKIMQKFDTIPNTGHMQIWLQRITIPNQIAFSGYDEPICGLVVEEDIELWDSSWIDSSELRSAVTPSCIVRKDVLEEIGQVILGEEFELFAY